MLNKLHSNKYPKHISFSLKTLSAAVVSAMLFYNANAAGLGKLTVLSSLGQPLHAEIELTSVGKEEMGTLAPKLAPVDAFRQANIDLNPALLSLRFAVEQRGGRHFIRVTSPQPINEPFVDMLLELNGANGRLIREYTFLLDPADLRSTQSPQVAAPIVLPPAALARRSPDPAPADTVQQPVPTERTSQPAAKPAPVAKAPQQGSARSAQRAAGQEPSGDAAKRAAVNEEYKVKSGDTLSKIASQFKVEGVSLDQMLVAMYRANPDAFIGNNMNRLRSGEILSVPDASTASGVNGSEAKGTVVAQAADFNSYRNKLAGQVATAEPQKSVESNQSATGKITAKVEEQANPANESKDKLKLSKAGVAPGASKSSNISADAEDRIAKDKALAEANARVKDLEKNVNDLQKILEVKNKELSDQQKQADAAIANAKQATPAAPAAVPPVASASDVKPSDATPNMNAEQPTPQANAGTASAPAPEAAPAVKPPPAVPKIVAPPPEPGFFEDPLRHPFFLPGAGVLLAALGGLGIYSVRRRRQNKQFEDSIVTDSSLKANSLFGSTGGQSVDTNNSVFNSNFAPSASQLDSNEVDPVAEADVYIAYGRDAQAEEILKEALRTQPGRNAVRVKLLEIYANRKDLRSFETLASELYGITKGEGEDWMQAATLGISIDPNNPLYAAGKSSDNGPKKAAALVAPTQPLEEPDLDALLAVTQSDPSLETLNTIEDSSYFGNTALAAEVPLPKADPEPPKPKQEQVEPKASSNDLDFDLDGMGLDQIETPNTIPRPMPAETQADLGDINFDFLDDKSSAAEPEPFPAASASPSDIDDLNRPLASPELGNVDDFLSAHKETASVPEIPKVDQSRATAEPAEPLEFDLSGMTLELNPGEGKPGLIEETYGVHDTGSDDYSSNAEMATKLDLAVAYQEIGDKEGARELLDEVVKGGTAEQTEKAKSLLLKLA
jgi:pilus assembly protein FimV